MKLNELISKLQTFNGDRDIKVMAFDVTRKYDKVPKDIEYVAYSDVGEKIGDTIVIYLEDDDTFDIQSVNR